MSAHFTLAGPITWVDSIDGKPNLSLFFSDAGPLEPEILNFIDAVCDPTTEGEVTLAVHVPLSEVVDGLIEVNRLTAFADSVVMARSMEDLVAEARAALQLAIGKLDGITFQ